MKGKTVVLCITGSIAAYKAADLVSRLRKQALEVYVVMTKSACEFITPLTLESLSGHPVACDLFCRETPWEVEHIALAKRADVFVVAPATANLIGKAARGIADDMATATLLATRAPLLFAPAMNTAMYENSVVQENINLLKARGARFVAPAEGRLACGDVGLGKLAEVADIERAILNVLTPDDLAGLSLLVTAGPTREALDPVRFLSNHSTGKMGYAIAARAQARGAVVTLVTGPTALPAPWGVQTVPVVSARDMESAVMEQLPRQDIIIKAAAVGDYRPAKAATEKIKKQAGGMTIELVRNPDILAELGERKQPGQIVCGFAMETQDLLENARDKLARKHCDLMVANDLRVEGAGFAGDTNVVTLLYPDGHAEQPGLLRKEELADLLLNRLLALRAERLDG